MEPHGFLAYALGAALYRNPTHRFSNYTCWIIAERRQHIRKQGQKSFEPRSGVSRFSQIAVARSAIDQYLAELCNFKSCKRCNKDSELLFPDHLCGKLRGANPAVRWFDNASERIKIPFQH